MPSRPLGVTFLSLCFGLLGIGALLQVLSTFAQSATFSPAPSGSRTVYVSIVVFLLCLGILALLTAVALWTGDPFGPVGGQVWVALWLASELVFLAASVFEIGPAPVQEADPGFLLTLIKAGIGAFVISYLRSTGTKYTGEWRTG